MNDNELIEEFNKLYYNSNVWVSQTYWMGIAILKCPLDLWIYQEIIFDIKPDIIIETGTWRGGTTLFLATICDLVQNGKVISVDVDKYPNRPNHPRILYLIGSSVAEETIDRIKNSILPGQKVMVILDSLHHKEYVLQEITVYSQIVTRDSYLIVEDTNINNQPVLPDFGPGPMEAITEFLDENYNFVIDNTKEKFLVTFSPNGYLKKISD